VKVLNNTRPATSSLTAFHVFFCERIHLKPDFGGCVVKGRPYDTNASIGRLPVKANESGQRVPLDFGLVQDCMHELLSLSDLGVVE
jgi:hypothetical protein